MALEVTLLGGFGLMSVYWKRQGIVESRSRHDLNDQTDCEDERNTRRRLLRAPGAACWRETSLI